MPLSPWILALGGRSSDVEARIRQDYQHSLHGQSNRWVMILFPHLLSGAPPCLLLISPFGVESLAREEEGEEGEEGRVKYRYVQECTSHEIVVIVGQKIILSDFRSLQKSPSAVLVFVRTSEWTCALKTGLAGFFSPSATFTPVKQFYRDASTPACSKQSRRKCCDCVSQRQFCIIINIPSLRSCLEDVEGNLRSNLGGEGSCAAAKPRPVPAALFEQRKTLLEFSESLVKAL